MDQSKLGRALRKQRSSKGCLLVATYRWPLTLSAQTTQQSDVKRFTDFQHRRPPMASEQMLELAKESDAHAPGPVRTQAMATCPHSSSKQPWPKPRPKPKQPPSRSRRSPQPPGSSFRSLGPSSCRCWAWGSGSTARASSVKGQGLLDSGPPLPGGKRVGVAMAGKQPGHIQLL